MRRLIFTLSALLAPILAGCAVTANGSLPQEDSAYPHPGASFQARIGAGDSEVVDRDPLGNGTTETDAAWFGLAFEGVGGFVGGGVMFDFLVSDDDQLENSSLVDSNLVALEVFPHVTLRPKAPHFRIPIRIGPCFTVHDLTQDNGLFDEDTVDFYGLGLQFEIEPEVDFFRKRNGMALSLFAKGRLGGGVAGVSTDTQVENEDYDTDFGTAGVEVGLRFQASAFQIEGAFLSRVTTYDQTDPADSGSGNVFAETEFGFTGFVLSLGARW